MKVFLSWSGHESHEVALVLKDWLPSVIQSITTYVSSEDIDKGARWSSDISKELEDSTFGILCVTKSNLEAPWLLFEAGALSKKTLKDYLCPFLFDLKMADIEGSNPILQFQATVFDKDDVKKLLKTVNKACGGDGLKENVLEKSFEIWWPELEKSLEGVKSSNGNGSEGDHKGKPQSKDTKKEEMLEEILELSRINQKILRSPDVLLPPEYLIELFCNANERSSSSLKQELIIAVRECRHRSDFLRRRLLSFRQRLNIGEDESKSDIYREWDELTRRILDQFDLFEELFIKLVKN